MGYTRKWEFEKDKIDKSIEKIDAGEEEKIMEKEEML